MIGTEYSPCALMLKDNPIEQVRFESFPIDGGITEGYNADYTKTVGRAAEPFGRMWQGGDWNPIQLDLEFRAGIGRYDLGPPGTVIGRMVRKVNWLKAAAFPRTLTRSGRSTKNDLGEQAKYGRQNYASYGGQCADPPLALFVWGVFMVIQGRVTAWTVNWVGPYEPITGRPHGAKVGLTFQPESGFYPNWYDVRDGSFPPTVAGKVMTAIT